MTASPNKSSPATKFAVIGGCFLALLIGLVLLVRENLGPWYTAEFNCASTIRQIESAKRLWMTDHHKTTNDIPTWSDLVGPDGYFPRIPKCPNSGGAYTIGRVSDLPTCSIAEHNQYYRKLTGLTEPPRMDASLSRFP